MVHVMEVSKAPVRWRATDPAVFEVLCSLRPGQVATDGVRYKGRYVASKAAMAYRELLRRRRPDLRMRSRIAYQAGGYRWFARVEQRTSSHE